MEITTLIFGAIASLAGVACAVFAYQTLKKKGDVPPINQRVGWFAKKNKQSVKINIGGKDD